MSGLTVQVSSRRFTIPFECPCCGAPPDSELRIPRARDATAATDSATGLDVPYCSRCIRHAKAWDHAGVGSAAVLVVGVTAFVVVSLVVARPLLGLAMLVASIPIALVVAGARRTKAKAGCSESCASPGMAVHYRGWNGTLTSLSFESLTYAARFGEHNPSTVLETPQLRKLLESHRVARLQVPTPVAAVVIPVTPNAIDWKRRIEQAKGPLARRTAFSRAMDAVHDADDRRELARVAANAELANVGKTRAEIEAAIAAVRADNIPDELQAAALEQLQARLAGA
jgi:hypothetical protein